MNYKNNSPEAYDYRLYRVIIQEKVNEEMADWFEGMDVRVDNERTVIEGRLIDQSELQGLLRKIHDLHLTLISVETITENQEIKKGIKQ